MRLNSLVFLLTAAALLLAESNPGTLGQRIEVRTNNGAVEITGSDQSDVTVSDASLATVMHTGDRTIVEGTNQPLHVETPRHASIEVVTSNGSIHVSGVTGALRLSTSNGEIVVTGSDGGGIHAQTSNGAIRLEVPRGINADLSAHTSNGQIHSGLTVAASHVGATFLEGKIGSGGTAIELCTSNGSIHIGNQSHDEKVSSTFTPGEVK